MEQKAIYELLAEKLGPGALGFFDEGVEPYADVTPSTGSTPPRSFCATTRGSLSVS